MVVRKNLNYRQMDDELRRFSRAQYQEDAEMAVVIVMAHGNEGKIICVDDRNVRFTPHFNTFIVLEFDQCFFSFFLV